MYFTFINVLRWSRWSCPDRTRLLLSNTHNNVSKNRSSITLSSLFFSRYGTVFYYKHRFYSTDLQWVNCHLCCQRDRSKQYPSYCYSVLHIKDCAQLNINTMNDFLTVYACDNSFISQTNNRKVSNAQRKRNEGICKKFRLMSACAIREGWHESKHFANHKVCCF